MIAVRGECSRCGVMIEYGDPTAEDFPANLFLTIPGLGIFRETIFKAELVCKNQLYCTERQDAVNRTSTDYGERTLK